MILGIKFYIGAQDAMDITESSKKVVNTFQSFIPKQSNSQTVKQSNSQTVNILSAFFTHLHYNR
jgi:RNA binding exosome subunit